MIHRQCLQALWCLHTKKTVFRYKNVTCVRKYARYGKTNHNSYKRISSSCRIFCGLPENTKTFKDSIKIDQVRAKTAKTRFVRESTYGMNEGLF